jgi:7-keto-8-aminopelargonate synthetase-like enzyme
VNEPSFFGGTAYLGIPRNEKFKNLVFEGIERYGVNYGASRNSNITLDIYSLAEVEAAKRCLAEDAIIVSSGYMAAQLVVQYYLMDYKFIYAPDTHPALWIGKPSPPQIQFTEWIEWIILEVNNSNKPVLLITNSLNNLIPEFYEFDWLAKIRSGQKVILLVDDSHGIGISGQSGEGVYSKIPQIPNIEIIVIASMAKALGVDAGLVLGNRKIMNDLRNSPVYAGSSPPSPGVVHAYVNAHEIYLEELNKLRENINFFAGFLQGQTSLRYLKNFPVFLIETPGSGDYLISKGIIISSFAYPDPKGKALDRIVINSNHSKEELKNLAGVLNLIKEPRGKSTDS